MRQSLDAVISFLFPPTCAGCQRVGALLCETCSSTLEWLEEPLCQCCGRVTVRAVEFCALCRKYPSSLHQIRAAVLYRGAIVPTIQKMKYEGMFALADPLVDIMEAAWPSWSLTPELVLPIPLHPVRERERGYNQSALLTEQLCERLNLASAASAIVRTRQTRPQVGLPWEERLRNVRSAFRAEPGHVRGKEILLVDDVCTTGATLNAAARALLQAGAASVSAFTVARASGG